MVIHTQIVWNVDIWARGNLIAHMRGLGIYGVSVNSSIEKHVSYYIFQDESKKSQNSWISLVELSWIDMALNLVGDVFK